MGAVPIPTTASVTPGVRGSIGGGGSCDKRCHSAVRRSMWADTDGTNSNGSPTRPAAGRDTRARAATADAQG